MMPDAIGWVATVVFSSSYFFKTAKALRCVQAIAAFLWIGYGISIASKPVVGANLMVAAGAIGSALAGRARKVISTPEESR
jgi:hypothetical protein